MSAELEEVFSRFSAFGSSRTVNGSNLDLHAEKSMDNARFAKLCRDSKVIDNRKVTTTDVDIVFKKFVGNGNRRIAFDGFVEALRELSHKRFPEKNHTEAFQAMVRLVQQNGEPLAKATMPEVGGIYEKLLYDQSTFPVTHKNRFNEDGTGKGKAGRVEDEATLTTDLSRVVNRSSQSGAKRAVHGSMETLQTTPKKNDIRTSTEKLSATKSTGSLNRLNYTVKSSPKTPRSNNSTPKKGGSVFDRLTDHTQYTGSHKHRFNEDGSGRGLDGRDSVPLGRAPGPYRGGDVKDLSQILRN